MAIQSSTSVQFGVYNANQQMKLKYVKSSDEDLIKATASMSNQTNRAEIAAIVTALQLRLKQTRKLDFIRQIDQALESLPLPIAETLITDLMEAYTRVQHGKAPW